jgi:hypothetical protein
MWAVQWEGYALGGSALDAWYICSYNVPIGGGPLFTGSVFDIVYRTIASAAAKPASVALGDRLTSKRP